MSSLTACCALSCSDTSELPSLPDPEAEEQPLGCLFSVIRVWPGSGSTAHPLHLSGCGQWRGVRGQWSRAPAGKLPVWLRHRLPGAEELLDAISVISPQSELCVFNSFSAVRARIQSRDVGWTAIFPASILWSQAGQGWFLIPVFNPTCTVWAFP